MPKKPVPAINIGPGRVLKRDMVEFGWSNSDLADVLELPEESVNQLLGGKQPITDTIARRLPQAFSTSLEFWLNLDWNYRRRLAEPGSTEDETSY
jgi:HTH-type transcriptional regulator / antitoxin HigA